VRSADGSTFTNFDVPNAGFNAVARGINASGQVVGYYIDIHSHNYFGFLRSADGLTYTTLNDPNGYFNTTSAWGINDAGQVVGWSVKRDGSGDLGFVRSADGSTYTTIQFPAAISTQALAISASGQIVGTYLDAFGKGHDFIATSVPEPSALALALIATVSLANFVWIRRKGSVGRVGVPGRLASGDCSPMAATDLGEPSQACGSSHYVVAT
jgi:uncharacterized membrane protein